jgi:hypothetical protein
MTAKRGLLSAQDADAISTSDKIIIKKGCRRQKIKFHSYPYYGICRQNLSPITDLGKR